MSSPTAYLAVAAMLALRSAASIHGMPNTRAELAEVLENKYKWRMDAEAIQKIIRQLDAWGCIIIIEDIYAGELLRLHRAKTDDALEKVAQAGHQELVAKASAGGSDWFGRVFSNQSFWDDLHKDPLPAPDSAPLTDESADTLVPASDRIVTKSDNRRKVEVLHADVRGLADEITTNNEISIELGDEKELILGELGAAEVILIQPSFRLARLVTLVLPALRFLTEKFATGAIGEMAKRIISALMGLS